LETIATVHRFVTARIERNLGNIAAVAARCLKHFARTPAAAFTHTHASSAVLRAHRLARGPAIGATVGLVLEAFLLVELLFTRAKYELAAAIDTVQHFIYVHETRNSSKYDVVVNDWFDSPGTLETLPCDPNPI